MYNYIDGLLRLLRESNVGCFIGNVFVGALAYADDIALLAPTPRAIYDSGVASGGQTGQLPPLETMTI